MKRQIVVLIFGLLLSGPAVAAAQPQLPQSQIPSITDIAELTKAGVEDAVILALIEVHRPVYPTDAETLKRLKAAGISPAVIVAMIKSGRSERPEAVPAVGAEPQPQPQTHVEHPTPVVVIEHESPRVKREVREVAVPVPVYVAVPSRSRIDDHGGRRPKPAEPVYWGWGGKLRPDAWKPSPTEQKDARIEPAQKK